MQSGAPLHQTRLFGRDFDEVSDELLTSNRILEGQSKPKHPDGMSLETVVVETMRHDELSPA